LGIAYAQHSGQNISVDYFISKVSHRPKIFLEFISTAIGLIFFALVTWQGFIGGYNSFKTKVVSDTLKIPLFPFEFLIGVGAFSICIEFLIKLITKINSKNQCN